MDDLFPHQLKLYYFQHKELVSLSIKVSEVFVQTYYLSVEDFENLLLHQREESGSEYGPYFVILKENFLRWTYNGQDGSQNFRIQRSLWEKFCKEYWTNKKNFSPDESHFSVQA